jgi:hypothetical protein
MEFCTEVLMLYTYIWYHFKIGGLYVKYIRQPSRIYILYIISCCIWWCNISKLCHVKSCVLWFHIFQRYQRSQMDTCGHFGGEWSEHMGSVAFLNGFRLQAGSNNKIFGMRMALSTCITLTIIQSHAHDPSFPGLTITDRKSNIY